MTLTFDTGLELSRWSYKHPLQSKIRLANGRKFEIRKNTEDKTNSIYQLYDRTLEDKKINLQLRGEFEIRDEMAKSLVPEDQLSAIEHSGNQRLTYLSFSQESQMTSKFKEEEISALMLLAFKLSKQAGNAGRLFIKGDTSHEKFYCKFLKKIHESKMTETFYMYLPQENASKFEQEMKLNVTKIKLLDEKKRLRHVVDSSSSDNAFFLKDVIITLRVE